MIIKVEHENGYSGVLYGLHSMAIYDQSGHEVLHTGNRNKINSAESLREYLGKVPEILKILWSMEND